MCRIRSSVANNHRTQLPLLFISRLGFAPRFRASGFAPPPPSGIHLKYPIRDSVAQLHSIAQLSNYAASCLNCYLLRMQHEAEVPSAETWWSTNIPEGRNRGPKSRIVAKIRTPFRPSGESTFPYSANFRDFMSDFGPRCKFFLREALEANLGKL